MAEGGGLLNRYRVKSSIGGSNPPLSAILHRIYLKLNGLSVIRSNVEPRFAGLFGTGVRDFKVRLTPGEPPNSPRIFR